MKLARERSVLGSSGACAMKIGKVCVMNGKIGVLRVDTNGCKVLLFYA
ncbi:hypothetical protein ACI6Q2_22965 [Chitinophagaceae bacterium LWZ2-11]